MPKEIHWNEFNKIEEKPKEVSWEQYSSISKPIETTWETFQTEQPQIKVIEPPTFSAGPGAVPFIPPDIIKQTEEYARAREEGAIPSSLVGQQAIVSGLTLGTAPKAFKPEDLPTELQPQYSAMETISTFAPWGALTSAAKSIPVVARAGQAIEASKLVKSAAKAEALAGGATKAAAAAKAAKIAGPSLATRLTPMAVESATGAAIGMAEGGFDKSLEERAKTAGIYAALPPAFHGAIGITKGVAKGAEKLVDKTAEAVGKLIGISDEVASPEVSAIIKEGTEKLIEGKKAHVAERLAKVKDRLIKLEGGEQPKLDLISASPEERQLAFPGINPKAIKTAEKIKQTQNIIGKLEKKLAEPIQLSQSDVDELSGIYGKLATEKGIPLSSIYQRKGISRFIENIMEPGQQLAQVDRKFNLGAADAYHSLVTAQGKGELANISNMTRFAKAEKAIGAKDLDQKLITEMMGFVDKDGNIVSQRILKDPETGKDIIVNLNKQRFGKDLTKYEEASKLHRAIYNEAIDEASAAGKPIPKKDFYSPIRYKSIPGVSSSGSFRPDIDPAFLHYQSGKAVPGKDLETDASKLMQRYIIEKNRYLHQEDATKKVFDVWVKTQATGNEAAIRAINQFIETSYGMKNPKEFGRLVGRKLLDEELEQLYGSSFDVGGYMYRNLLAYNIKGMIRNAATPLTVGIPEVGSKSVARGFSRFMSNPTQLKKEAREAGLVIPFAREEMELAKKEVKNRLAQSVVGRTYSKFIDAGMLLWEKSEKFTRLWMFATGKDMALTMPKGKLIEASRKVFGSQRAMELSTLYDKLGRNKFADEFGKMLSDKVNLVYSKSSRSTLLNTLGPFGQFLKWNMRQSLNIAEDLARGNIDTVAKKLAVPYLVAKTAEKVFGMDLGDMSVVGGGGAVGAPLTKVLTGATKIVSDIPEAAAEGKPFQPIVTELQKTFQPLIPASSLIRGIKKGVKEGNPFGLIKKGQ